MLAGCGRGQGACSNWLGRAAVTRSATSMFGHSPFAAEGPSGTCRGSLQTACRLFNRVSTRVPPQNKLISSAIYTCIWAGVGGGVGQGFPDAYVVPRFRETYNRRHGPVIAVDVPQAVTDWEHVRRVTWFWRCLAGASPSRGGPEVCFWRALESSESPASSPCWDVIPLLGFPPLRQVSSCRLYRSFFNARPAARRPAFPWSPTMGRRPADISRRALAASASRMARASRAPRPGATCPVPLTPRNWTPRPSRADVRSGGAVRRMGNMSRRSRRSHDGKASAGSERPFTPAIRAAA